MGLLVAKKYPTKLFLKAADHTYVECGTGGKGWSCWGGKAGGTPFNSGKGSTSRADCIATPNEKARIKCYLVNGVCHQAANRILLPAGILVTKARGYGVSSGIFGTYGKVGSWPCSSPFQQCTNTTGDLPECIANAGSPDDEEALAMSQMDPIKEREFNQTVRELYGSFDESSLDKTTASEFHTRLFEIEVRAKLGEGLGRAEEGLIEAKQLVERKHTALIEDFQKDMTPVEFIKDFNTMTLNFQSDVATALDSKQFTTLMDTDRDNPVVLADPDIIERLYGKEVVYEIYGDI